MKKEPVKKFDLEAAFKALDEIEIPQAEKGIKANRVDLKERFNNKPAYEALVEDYYDVTDHEDLVDAQDDRNAEIAKAKLARIEKIVDLDAESPEDLLPSYVGKVIIQCPQCMTLFYKNPEDIEHSDENPDVVNINEVCQHCGNASGYTLIGKVGAVEEDEAGQYTEEPVAKEESDLDLDFEEPTEEVDAEGTGEGAEEMSDEAKLSDEEQADLDLNLEEIPEEDEEKKEESLNLSKELKDAEEGSELATEHESENLTLNEEAETVDESINNSEAQKDAEECSELKTENESENLTLNEKVDCETDDCNPLNEADVGIDAEIKNIIDSWSLDDVKEAIEDCKDGICECGEKPLKEENEVSAEEEAPIEEIHVEGEEANEENPIEEEPKEELLNVEFNTEEVKDIVKDVAEEAAEKAVEIQAEEDLDGETKDRVADLADEKVADAVEEKVEAEEAPVEGEEIEETEEVVEESLNESDDDLDKLLDSEEFKKPISDAEVRSYFEDVELPDLEDLDEASFNEHIDSFLKEVYSNVKSFNATSCIIRGNKLVVEGKITFNSDKEKSTVFEFMPRLHEGKLLFEGVNHDFSNDNAFKLNCSIDEAKKLITESLEYKYRINETLVEGLK